MKYQISRELATEIQELIEDSVGYLCDENTISGEFVWNSIECLSQAKLAELEDDLTVGRLDKLSKKKATPAPKSNFKFDW